MMKNEYYIDTVDPVVLVYLKYKGETMSTVIDLEDFSLVNAYKNSWYVDYDRCTKGFYVVSKITVNGVRKRISLHRYIMGLDDSKKVVDHINHDTLDNRRENLRMVDHSINSLNPKGLRVNNKSGEKGVFWYSRYNKWCVQLTLNRKQKNLGYYESFEEAIKVRDAYAQPL
jgi:hypothetical protein